MLFLSKAVCLWNTTWYIYASETYSRTWFYNQNQFTVVNLVSISIINKHSDLATFLIMRGKTLTITAHKSDLSIIIAQDSFYFLKSCV